MERPLRPAGRLPRPARRPLGRLRATHQGPYRAREGTTRGACPHVDYVLTREGVSSLPWCLVDRRLPLAPDVATDR